MSLRLSPRSVVFKVNMKNKINVAILINSSWNVVNFRQGLVRGLQGAGYAISVIAPRDAYSDEILAMGCRFVPIMLNRKAISIADDLFSILAYARILRRERPDIVLGFTAKPNVYGTIAARVLGIPVINNIAGLGEAFLKKGALATIVSGLYRIALGGSKWVFFQNPDDRALFLRRKLVAESRVSVLPGSGVDLARFTPQAVASSPFAFLLVSRLLWPKGIGDYVEAARAVRAQGHDVVFRLLGPFDEGSRTGIPRTTIAAWHDEGIIDYLGASDDVRPHLAEASCVVLPTFYPEGVPRALLEAAAMAKPLIATDVPGCREIVADAENGYLCEARNVTALTTAMLRMLGHTAEQRRSMGMASRNKAEHRFDEQLVVRSYLNAIEGVRDQGRRRGVR